MYRRLFFLIFLFLFIRVSDLSAQLSVDSEASSSPDTNSGTLLGGDTMVLSPAQIPLDHPDTVQPQVDQTVFRPQQIWDSIFAVPPGSIQVQADDRVEGEKHHSVQKEGLFYALLGMLMGLAFFRRFFPKYWNDLFRLFFRTTLRQRHLRDQLELASLPSMFLNAFFFLCLSFYLSLFFTHRGWNPMSGFWMLWLLVLAGLMGMYLIKWVGLQFASWIFGQPDLGEDYTFLVFTVNKMMGLLLLPPVIFLAFGEGRVWEWSLGLSWFLIGGLLLYRGFLTYRVVRRQAVVSPFHFFLYWVGFELAPLLVLYRFLQGFFGEMT
ncbi:MAG: DUF4271 domain-containing protein [Bacteroidetes bacterium]|nr:DUF4271 domain-containing protein [Bacteroidota bacterium]